MKARMCVYSVLLVFCIAFTAFYGGSRISKKKEYFKEKEYKGIVTLWQIDTFEGGSGSRKQFLLSVAKKFEKLYDGTLILVVSHTVESAKNSFNNGECPDLVSYGVGLEVPNLKEVSSGIKNVVKNSGSVGFLGGSIGEKLYAVAWANGCYVLISNPKLEKENVFLPRKIDNLLVSQNSFTQPCLSLALENLSVNDLAVKSPLEAYVKFTENKTPYFLGTQRDVVRLLSRGMEFRATPITSYNDLYQYISLTCNNSEKSVYAEKFIEFLIGKEAQTSLNKIDMFSPYYPVTYSVTEMAELQNAKYKSTVSAFTAELELGEIQRDSYLALRGNQEELIKIKKLVLYP